MTLRRDLLGFTAGAMASGGVLANVARADGVVATTIPSGHPDAELLQLAEQFLQHEQAMQYWPCDALPGTPEDEQQDAEQRRMIGVQSDLTLRLGLLRATTADGVLARARCLAVHNADGAFSMDEADTTTGRLVRYLMRDAGAVAGLVLPRMLR